MEENGIKRPTFGFRLREAPYMGDSGGNKSKCGNPQLLLVFDFFSFRFTRGLRLLLPATFAGGGGEVVL